MRRQDGFSVIHGLLLVILVTIIGFAGWYVYNSKQQTNKSYDAASNSAGSTVTPQPTEGGSVPLQAETADGYKGGRVTSAAKKLSLVVPNGSTVYVCDTGGSSTDLLYTGTLVYNATAKADAKSSSCGKDGPSLFTAVYQTNKDYKPAEGDVSSFGAVDGLSGNLYTKVYQAGEPLGIAAAEAGDTMYTYEFKGSQGVYTVDYFKQSSKDNVQPLVEQIVRSLKFSQR